MAEYIVRKGYKCTVEYYLSKKKLDLQVNILS